jgi:hypothetical protein
MMWATMMMARVARVMVTAKRVPGNKEGKGGKDHGIGDEGGMQQRGRWQQQRGQWQQGWWASNGDNGDGNNNSNSTNVGNGDGDEADRQQRGQGQGWQG